MSEQILPLTDQERQTLSDFLHHKDRPQGTLNYLQVYGFLYSVLCAPEFLSTEDWLPVIFNGESANAEKQTEMQVIITILVKHYKEAFDDLMSGKCSPPLNLQWSDDKDKRFHLEQFCQGFITGFTWIEPRWKNAIIKFNEIDTSLRGETDLEQHLYAILGLISTLAAPEFNLEKAQDKKALQENLPGFAEQLPDAIYALAQIGGQIEQLFQTLAEHNAEQTS